MNQKFPPITHFILMMSSFPLIMKIGTAFLVVGKLVFVGMGWMIEKFFLNSRNAPMFFLQRIGWKFIFLLRSLIFPIPILKKSSGNSYRPNSMSVFFFAPTLF